MLKARNKNDPHFFGTLEKYYSKRDTIPEPREHPLEDLCNEHDPDLTYVASQNPT